MIRLFFFLHFNTSYVSNCQCETLQFARNSNSSFADRNRGGAVRRDRNNLRANRIEEDVHTRS